MWKFIIVLSSVMKIFLSYGQKKIPTKNILCLNWNKTFGQKLCFVIRIFCLRFVYFTLFLPYLFYMFILWCPSVKKQNAIVYIIEMTVLNFMSDFYHFISYWEKIILWPHINKYDHFNIYIYLWFYVLFLNRNKMRD